MALITNSGKVFILFLVFLFHLHFLEAKCNLGCDTSLASYYLTNGSNLTAISNLFGKTFAEALQFNRNSNTIFTEDKFASFVRFNVPFSCDCYPDPETGPFLAHTFSYLTRKQDRYDTVANSVYANLTTEQYLAEINTYSKYDLPARVRINVTVNCSCGDARVSKDYGLFLTYPLRQGENLSSVASAAGVAKELLQMYNPGVDFAAGSGLVFVPGKDQNGSFPPLKQLNPRKAGKRHGSVAGIVAASASAAALLFVVFGVYHILCRRKKGADSGIRLGVATFRSNVPGKYAGKLSSRLVEFQFEELAEATNNFVSNKIGEGGFGSVYYAELRGEKGAIKKMHKQEPRGFVAELKVLGNVNHLNLVRLIGFCIERSLFLVYEFMENGNLSEHLQDPEREALPWPTRVQIALDSARGLQYIHEHTSPAYIHRDIKPENILLDKDCRAKIADFGLTKLINEGETGGDLHTSRAKGTWGYMAPEYAIRGLLSPKMDVYSFGMVLYQLISAKSVIIETQFESSVQWITLRSLFEDALTLPDAVQSIGELVDRRLGDDCPIDAVYQMALVAKACTREKPEQRPSMRSVVVALSILCSSAGENTNIYMFIEDPTLRNPPMSQFDE